MKHCLNPSKDRLVNRALQAAKMSVLCLALAGLLGVAAIVDHSDKQRRINRAEEAEWYCLHRRTHCGGPSSARIESRWQQRQWGYEIAVVSLAGFGVVRLLYQLARL